MNAHQPSRRFCSILHGSSRWRLNTPSIAMPWKPRGSLMSWTNIWERETNSTSAESLCLEFEVVGSNLHGQVVNCTWKDIGQQTDVVFFAFVLCSDRTSLRTSLLSEVVTRTHHFTGNMFLPVSIPAGFQAFNKKRSAKNSQLPSFFFCLKTPRVPRFVFF